MLRRDRKKTHHADKKEAFAKNQKKWEQEGPGGTFAPTPNGERRLGFFTSGRKGSSERSEHFKKMKVGTEGDPTGRRHKLENPKEVPEKDQLKKRKRKGGKLNSGPAPETENGPLIKNRCTKEPDLKRGKRKKKAGQAKEGGFEGIPEGKPNRQTR